MSFSNNADILNERQQLRLGDITEVVDELIDSLENIKEDAVTLDRLVDELDDWLDESGDAEKDDLQYYIESARKTLDKIRDLI